MPKIGTGKFNEILLLKPEAGQRIQFGVEVYCHFDGKSMGQSFPIIGKSFSLYPGNRTSKTVLKSGYSAGKAFSTARPRVWSMHC
jgi:hypothetical protein